MAARASGPMRRIGAPPATMRRRLRFVLELLLVLAITAAALWWDVAYWPLALRG